MSFTFQTSFTVGYSLVVHRPGLGDFHAMDLNDSFFQIEQAVGGTDVRASTTGPVSGVQAWILTDDQKQFFGSTPPPVTDFLTQVGIKNGVACGLNNVVRRDGVNLRSQVVGYVTNLASGDEFPVAFEHVLRTIHEIPLNGFPTLRVFGRAYDINEQGDIVGWLRGGRGTPQAVLWEQTDPPMRRTTPNTWNLPISLGTLPGGDTSEARRINRNRQAVGCATDASGTFHAFRWSFGRGMQDLHPMSPSTTSEALDINGNGDVVGTIGPVGRQAGGILGGGAGSVGGPGSGLVGGPGGGVPDAFLWTDQLGMQLLPPLRSGIPTEAIGINDRGFIVGSSGADATLWISGRVFKLQDQLTTPFPGRLRRATAINNKNQILGEGVNSSNESIFWIATPVSLNLPVNEFIYLPGAMKGGLTPISPLSGSLTWNLGSLLMAPDGSLELLASSAPESNPPIATLSVLEDIIRMAFGERLSGIADDDRKALIKNAVGHIAERIQEVVAPFSERDSSASADEG